MNERWAACAPAHEQRLATAIVPRWACTVYAHQRKFLLRPRCRTLKALSCRPEPTRQPRRPTSSGRLSFRVIGRVTPCHRIDWHGGCWQGTCRASAPNQRRFTLPSIWSATEHSARCRNPSSRLAHSSAVIARPASFWWWPSRKQLARAQRSHVLTPSKCCEAERQLLEMPEAYERLAIRATRYKWTW